jgi:hypothetical protein
MWVNRVDFRISARSVAGQSRKAAHFDDFFDDFSACGKYTPLQVAADAIVLDGRSA